LPLGGSPRPSEENGDDRPRGVLPRSGRAVRTVDRERAIVLACAAAIGGAVEVGNGKTSKRGQLLKGDTRGAAPRSGVDRHAHCAGSGKGRWISAEKGSQ